MTVLLGVSMGAHAVRMALPRNGAAAAPSRQTSRRTGPQQLFFKNQVIDTVDDDVEYLAAESIGAVAAESEPSMATGVAYRDAHQADTLHRALEHRHLNNYHLVHEVEAVVEYLVASGEASGYGTVALFDLGSSGLNVSVVDLAARRVFVTRRSSEFSGDHFDDILRDNQLERLGKSRDAADIELFSRRCRVAKERLSSNDAVCLPDASGMILLSRETYETLIEDEVDRAIEFAREVMISAHVPIDAVVLIGGSSRTPLIRTRVGPSLELPALAPNEPESVAARGAALSARPAEDEGAHDAYVERALPTPQPAFVAAADTPEPEMATPTSHAAGSHAAGSVIAGSNGAGSNGVAANGAGSDAAMFAGAVSAGAVATAVAPSSLASSSLASSSGFGSTALRSSSSGGASTGTLTRERDTTTIPPLAPSRTEPEATGPEPEEPSTGESHAEAPAENVDGAPSKPKHFALQNVYWLDADYEDDDGEDDSERRSRLVRSWSVVGVAAAAVIAISGFLLTRPSDGPAVDTAVNDAPADSVAPSPPVADTPEAPAPPPEQLPPPEELPPPPEVIPEPANEVPQVAEPVYTPPPQDTWTPEPPAPEPAPEPTAELPPPAPEPPPLIPGLPNFTLPTIPPLFPAP